MRTPQYLSPTSISTYNRDPKEFYLKYLAERRPPREPQTQPMSIGSSFDAYVKSYLYEKLFGKGKDPRFDLITLFEAQVERHNRDWALEHGKIVFDQYCASGSLSDLMMELEGSIREPRFESELFGRIDGIPLLGKPDVYFINKKGAHVILDWKVNGYCSQWGASPAPGFVRLREVGEASYCHRDGQYMVIDGILVNISHYLETVNKEWAGQISCYSWLCGEDVGGSFIAAIDQIACKNGRLRFAQHRNRISSKFQFDYFGKAQLLWQAIQTGYIFPDLTREESDQECQRLDDFYKAFEDGDELFKQLTRG